MLVLLDGFVKNFYLHWGWARDVLVCCTFSKVKSSCESLLLNSFLPSVWICARMPNFTKPFWKNSFCHCFSFFVFHRHHKHIFCESISDTQDVFVLTPIGHHWSEQIHVYSNIGWSRIGSGWSGGSLTVEVLCCWHHRHVLVCCKMSE